MQEQVNVTFANGQVRQYSKGTTLLEISSDVAKQYTTPILIAKVDYELKDLQFPVTCDCMVEFYDMTTGQGMKAYERTVTFIMIVAAQDLFPTGEITVEHAFGQGIYCELHLDRPTTLEDIKALEERMRLIVSENRPIVRRSMLRTEAIQLLQEAGLTNKVQLIQQLERERVILYYCGDTFNYFYGKMAPSTGYMQSFELTFYHNGLILRLPVKELGVIPKFVDQPKLAQVFLEAEKWGSILHCGYVSTLNEYAKQGISHEIIRVAEALHEKKLAHIADMIAAQKKDIRLVLVAGPSSSGKTTFAQRLGIQLRVNGIKPVSISLDDYFVDREHTPRDAYGDFDFEAIEAIDLSLFNEHLLRLMKGEEVKIPSYNFMTGQREYRGHKIRLGENQLLIIEGIHGLNERLTGSVARELKMKVYVSAITQLAIDNHNRIPTTDTRLIRRIVRDSQFRAHDALRTLQLWPAVRRGEERNIFPYQEEADVMFNSALIYELAVLKRHAEPLLRQVSSDCPEYMEAQRLLDFLEFFIAVDDDEIPVNSILREFTGKSCFVS